MVGFQDLVTSNSLLAAYSVHQQGALAMKTFMDMQVNGFEPDVYTFTIELPHSLPIGFECGSDNSTISGRCFEHTQVHGYARSRSLGTLILSGFSQNGLSENALKCFKRMLSELLKLISMHFLLFSEHARTWHHFNWVNKFIAGQTKMRNDLFDYVTSSLIFMYCTCGCIEDARKAFDETPQDTAIIWNSIIFGYAQHGQGYTALDLFYSMRDRLVKQDHITFVAVLTACSHIGLLDEGCSFLSSMESDYGIPPRMEHYACAVDLCGRAGRLDWAEALIKRMPFEPDATPWHILTYGVISIPHCLF
uniref:Pentatricopeptide repeat-containing protein n=1 Tax=Kalanchoe fedtschenkoi TaxID=63787 RepID=A0A7N0SVE6_KALFE